MLLAINFLFLKLWLINRIKFLDILEKFLSAQKFSFERKINIEDKTCSNVVFLKLSVTSIFRQTSFKYLTGNLFD